MVPPRFVPVAGNLSRFVVCRGLTENRCAVTGAARGWLLSRHKTAVPRLARGCRCREAKTGLAAWNRFSGHRWDPETCPCHCHWFMLGVRIAWAEAGVKQPGKQRCGSVSHWGRGCAGARGRTADESGHMLPGCIAVRPHARPTHGDGNSSWPYVSAAPFVAAYRCNRYDAAGAGSRAPMKTLCWRRVGMNSKTEKR